MTNEKTVGIAGLGAIGQSVYKALQNGIDGYRLHAVSELNPSFTIENSIPNVDFTTLAKECDLIIECLPPAIVPALAQPVLSEGKDLILISACALLLTPEILEWHGLSTGRIIVPSGALIGLDGVNALKNIGIEKSKIISKKPPMGFASAPLVENNNIDLKNIENPTCLFTGNAYEAAKAFPANVNVAATLSFAGIGPERTEVEVWADPQTNRNSHEIIVESRYSRMQALVQNDPDPANPKTSVLAAQSIIAVLKGFTDPLTVL